MQPEMRMTWLRARMPRFTHHEDEKDAILSYLINHDRISDGADSASPAPPRRGERRGTARRRTAARRRGLQLHRLPPVRDLRPQEYGCPGTKGSDLMGLGNRLRPEYFSLGQLPAADHPRLRDALVSSAPSRASWGTMYEAALGGLARRQ